MSDDLQKEIAVVTRDVWGEKAFTPRERLLRFTEEALELMQAAGLSKEDLLIMVDYVYDRAPGEISQEIAGTGYCLFGMADVHGHSFEGVLRAELERIKANKERLRAKHAAKPQSIRDRAA